MKKIIISLLFFQSLFVFPKNSEFVIESKVVQKSSSKNELKERIGSKLKSVMDECASIVQDIGDILPSAASQNVQKAEAFDEVSGINNATGEILKIIGSIQKDFSNKAQSLIENQNPFKKASKLHLEEAVKTTENVFVELHDQSKFLKTLQGQLDKELKVVSANDNRRILHVIKTAHSDLKSRLDAFKKIRTTISETHCLK